MAAFSLNEKGHPMYLKFHFVNDFSLDAISIWAQANLAPQTRVHSDSLAFFAAVSDGECLHVPMVVGSLKHRDVPEFRWVDTLQGIFRTTLAGALHPIHYLKYAAGYPPPAFANRRNRSFDLRGLVASYPRYRANETSQRIDRQIE